jgi:hypothetical protein
MILWVTVYREHYERFLEVMGLTDTKDAFKRFLSEIGTPFLSFQKPVKVEDSNSVSYKEVSEGSCIRLRTAPAYTAVLHQKLFSASHEKQDKSRRSSSCSIV